MANTIRISQVGEYASGVVIETFGFWNRDEPSWAEPAWDERGLADLCGPFATRDEARTVIKRERDYLESLGYRIAA